MMEEAKEWNTRKMEVGSSSQSTRVRWMWSQHAIEKENEDEEEEEDCPLRCRRMELVNP